MVDTARKLCYTVDVAYHGKEAAIVAEEKDVFISYHEESAGEKSPGKIVPKIAAALEDVGVSCWYAERDLTDTGSFAATITKSIRACKIFLLVLNEGSNQSEHVKNELHFAFEHKNLPELLPFKVDNCNISDDIAYYIGRLQITDGNPPDAQHIQQLIEQIKGALFNLPVIPIPIPIKIIDKGKCGNNVNYTLDKSGLLTISGTGPMWNFEYNKKTNVVNTPWLNDCALITRVNIEPMISTVGKYAFCDCVNLTSVTIPESVTKIEVGAFDSCVKLPSVTIPQSVTQIGVGAFNVCKSLDNVRIPDGVTKIEFGAFSNCCSLRYIYIPDSVTKIDMSAFSGCINLTNVSVPAKVKIGLWAFPGVTTIIRRPPPK